jgi:hypothetical protein
MSDDMNRQLSVPNQIPVPGQQAIGVKIKSVTVSLDLSEKIYGTGPAVYQNCSAWVDGATLDRLPDVIDASLDIFVASWRVLVAGQLATKLSDMKATEFEEMLAATDRRLAKIKAILREPLRARSNT